MTARISGFLDRKTLGMRPPRSISRAVTPIRGGACTHYGGPAQRIRSHADCIRTWLAWQRYHMDSHGWVDIAYTAGFCDHGFVFAGRGYGVRTAAMGTNDGNQRFHAFVWIGGAGEKPTQEALDALEWLINDNRQNGGAGMEVRDHSDFRSTACAGPDIRAHGRQFHNRQVSAVQPTIPNIPPKKPAAPKPPTTSTNLLRQGDKGGAVVAWQRQLRSWNRHALPRFGADGDFGAETLDWTKRFQSAARITADGIVGPQTRTAMEAALKPPPKVKAPTPAIARGPLLRLGERGPDVAAWQRALRSWNRQALPRYGVDGDFGGETDSWTRRFQRQAKIAVDGIVGPQTRRAMVARL